MKYHTLQIYKYNHIEKGAVGREYKRRFNNPLTIVTNLKYFVDGFTYPLYFVPIREILLNSSQIYQNSIKISNLTNHLSKLSQGSFFWGNLRKEIRSTNKIEGLHTTTKEINTAIHHAVNKSKRHVHFEPFTQMYLKIDSDERLSIHKLKDIRDIYNRLFKGIFNSKTFPNKTLFRNRPIRIGDNEGTVYRPKSTEQAFKPDLMDWISFINNTNIPPLIKSCIAHFFFECIHPFNDGNGRTGRYIFCTYLGNILDKYTAISFSQEINRHESPYYKAFQSLDDPVNHGEITFFVLSVFKIIIKAQRHLIYEVLRKSQYLKHMLRNAHQYKLSHNSLRVFSCLGQVQIFNQKDIPTDISDLRKIFHGNLSSYKLRKALHQLSKVGIVRFIKQKPLTAVIPVHQLEIMCGVEKE